MCMLRIYKEWNQKISTLSLSLFSTVWDLEDLFCLFEMLKRRQSIYDLPAPVWNTSQREKLWDNIGGGGDSDTAAAAGY